MGVGYAVRASYQEKKKKYRGNYGQLDGLNERRDVKRNAMRDIIFFILITNII